MERKHIIISFLYHFTSVFSEIATHYLKAAYPLSSDKFFKWDSTNEIYIFRDVRRIYQSPLPKSLINLFA